MLGGNDLGEQGAMNGVTSDGEAEFDQFRRTYESELSRALTVTGQGADVFTEAKVNVLLELARAHVGDPSGLTVLDVGCGTGATDTYLVGQVASLSGVDVSGAMVERATEANPRVEYKVYDGERLPYDEDSFDLAFAICVMHHVPPASWTTFLREMRRVVKRQGIVTVFEHNPFNPMTRLIVSRCSFDEDAVLLGDRRCRKFMELADLDVVESRNILFLPWRNAVVERFERLTRRVPLGAQYVLAGRPNA